MDYKVPRFDLVVALERRVIADRRRLIEDTSYLRWVERRPVYSDPVSGIAVVLQEDLNSSALERLSGSFRMLEAVFDGGLVSRNANAGDWAFEKERLERSGAVRFPVGTDMTVGPPLPVEVRGDAEACLADCNEELVFAASDAKDPRAISRTV